MLQINQIVLRLIAVFRIQQIGCANTIAKNVLEFVKEIQLITNEKPNDDFVRICYLMSTKTRQPVEGVFVTTNTYWCVNYPEIPSNETIYIGG